MSKESDNLLQVRIEQIKKNIREIGDPQSISNRCGLNFHENNESAEFSFSLLNTQVEISYPELRIYDKRTGGDLPTPHQALICYYITPSSDSPEVYISANEWVSFTDLPDGRFYNQAFQSYTGDKLATSIETNFEKFSKVALRLNGSLLEMADISYRFLFLPKVPVAVVFWKGDEDFPPSCQILFDSSARFYLPTDACAILGSMLTQMILKQIKS